MFSREAPIPNDRERQQQSPASPDDPKRLSEERRVIAWVGKSVVFTGHLTSLEDMTIDGRVEGTIEVRNHTLTIGPDADIRAKIIANSVIVLGSVTGTITARTRLDIRETASVDGDIVSPALAVADGAILRGRVNNDVEGHPERARPSIPADSVPAAPVRSWAGA